ncbi:MAG TPA: metallophosphoesterase [Solirubrobacteraceae bacterium]|nr:metallophosphoesterase [Solirubrobacteraceae bacterium]
MPLTIVQITDPHLGARFSDDPGAALAAAVATIAGTLATPPDAVVVSGDIASTPTDGEYAEARALLDGIGVPLYALPGNHDDRDSLRRHFELPQGDDASISYAVSLGAARLVALDSTLPGSDGGRLDSARLRWLDRTLHEDPVTPTLLAMHHPPITTGIPAMDAIGIPEDERASLAEVLARHRQVQLVTAGHVHRTIVGAIAGTRVLAIPSTDVQLGLDLEASELRFVREPPCVAIHLVPNGQIVSHIQPVVTATH